MTDVPIPGVDPDGLDGHTLDELGEYLDRGRTPVDPSIESSPACRIALAGLERLRSMAGELLEQDAAAAEPDERWIDTVLGRISLESRAGRRFVFPDVPAGTEAVVTEGALRGLVRAIGDSVPGLLTGLEVDLDVVYGTAIEDATAELRRRVAALLPLHAPFTVGRLDLHVRDVVDTDAAER